MIVAENGTTKGNTNGGNLECSLVDEDLKMLSETKYKKVVYIFTDSPCEGAVGTDMI